MWQSLRIASTCIICEACIIFHNLRVRKLARSLKLRSSESKFNDVVTSHYVPSPEYAQENFEDSARLMCKRVEKVGLLLDHEGWGRITRQRGLGIMRPVKTPSWPSTGSSGWLSWNMVPDKGDTLPWEDGAILILSTLKIYKRRVKRYK